uniref:Uncharacterized protein n=1 Tax=Cyprinus carpio TaxID=7962 RepID=A0A8C1GW90_CYPCA
MLTEDKGLIWNGMDLPEEILAHIFSFLPLQDKCNAFTVCKAWSNIMTHPSSWKDTEILLFHISGDLMEISIKLRASINCLTGFS